MTSESQGTSPVLSYKDFDAARIKHLEMVQVVIGRLAGNGFLMKGWAITVAGVFFGFAVNVERWELALASMVPTIVFWSLDAYFLRAERIFRELYRRIATQDPGVEPFFMAATGAAFIRHLPEETTSYRRTAFRRPVLALFYGGLLLAGALILAVVACAFPQPTP